MVEGPLNNLKQSMVQFQKPKKVNVFPLIIAEMHPEMFVLVPHQCYFWYLQIYNDRRLFLGGGQGVVHGANFGAGASPAADKRSGRGKGMYSLHIHVVFFVLHKTYLSTCDIPSPYEYRTIICSLWPPKWSS